MHHRRAWRGQVQAVSPRATLRVASARASAGAAGVARAALSDPRPRRESTAFPSRRCRSASKRRRSRTTVARGEARHGRTPPPRRSRGSAAVRPAAPRRHRRSRRGIQLAPTPAHAPQDHHVIRRVGPRTTTTVPHLLRRRPLRPVVRDRRTPDRTRRHVGGRVHRRARQRRLGRHRGGRQQHHLGDLGRRPPRRLRQQRIQPGPRRHQLSARRLRARPRDRRDRARQRGRERRGVDEPEHHARAVGRRPLRRLREPGGQPGRGRRQRPLRRLRARPRRRARSSA